MSHLPVLRPAQSNRKRGRSRQGGAGFGMAECSGGRLRAHISCPELPFSSVGEVSALLAHSFIFFPPPSYSRVREGLDYTCLIAL